MPNTIAYLTLAAWPIIALLFSRKFTARESAILLVLVPLLFLPERTTIDLPALPEIDKHFIAALTVLAVMVTQRRHPNFLVIPGNGAPKILLISLFIFPILTMVSNTDRISLPGNIIPGLAIRDLLQLEFRSFFLYYVPFVLGWKLLGDADGHRTLLHWFLGFGLFYSVLMLWEIRMSPQLHTQLYGFFPHGWAQQIRGGSFRPVVFQLHSLETAILAAYWMVTAATLVKARDPILRRKGAFVLVYFVVLVFLCRSLGAQILAISFTLLLLTASTKVQLRTSALIAVLVICYPLAKSAHVFPTDTLLSSVATISEERAASLNYRIEQENHLMQRARERILFGWGTWGRNRVRNEFGEDTTVSDGDWIITLGSFGLFGYITIFGLIAGSILHIHKVSKVSGANISAHTCGLVGIMCINLVDLLPNSSMSIFSMLVAGALFGLKPTRLKSPASESL